MTSQPETRSTRRAVRRSASERRECIIAAARTLFARQGFHGTGMAQIARESEVLVGQIYRDFASKEDLIAAIVERDVSELLDDPALSRAVADGDADRLRAWIAGFVARCPDDELRRVFAAIVAEAARDQRVGAILTEAQDRLRGRIADALRVLVPGDDSAAARAKLADFIVTVAGAVLHRNICALGQGHDAVVTRLVELVDAEIDAVAGGARASRSGCA